MAIAMMVDNPEGSQEVYEQIRAQLGVEKPAGGIFHFAGPSPNGGWRVIEVWVSEEDATRFFEEHSAPALAPAARLREPAASHAEVSGQMPRAPRRWWMTARSTKEGDRDERSYRSDRDHRRRARPA